MYNDSIVAALVNDNFFFCVYVRMLKVRRTMQGLQR